MRKAQRIAELEAQVHDLEAEVQTLRAAIRCIAAVLERAQVEHALFGMDETRTLDDLHVYDRG